MKGQTIDIRDLDVILYYIENKTGLFLLRRDLELLYSFLSAYKLIALSDVGYIKNIDKLEDFYEFVHKKFDLKDINSMSWFGTIQAEYGSGKEGFDKFFELYKEFNLQYKK